MVEHTSINPNKAAHIGHVRNAVLGDTFVRILKAAGDRVEVQNYIDNTGVQVADVVVGFLHIEKMDLDEIKALDASLTKDYPFDYYCWDLYTKVGLFYRDGNASGEMNPEKLKLRNEVLHALEEGGEPDRASSPITSPHETSSASSTRWSGSAFVTICSRVSQTFCTCTFGIALSS